MKAKWVSIFGSAISITENKPESYGKNITLRYPIHLPFDGDKIKIDFKTNQKRAIQGKQAKKFEIVHKYIEKF